MSLAEVIPLLLKASIYAIVFSIGLRAGLSEATWALRHPRPLMIGVFAMFVVMPLVSAALAALFELPPPVELILVAVALSPVPPILPNKELKAGARAAQAVGLMVAAGLLAIVMVPFGAELIASWFGLDVEVPVALALKIVATSILIPLAAGLLLRAAAPKLAERIADPVGKLASAVLLLAVLLIVVKSAPAMWRLVGGGTLAAFAAFVAIGLGVGHVLGGPDDANRTVLALATASRHPAIALAIATAVAPDAPLLMPAILLYLLLGAVVTGVYLAVRRRRAAPAPAPMSG